MLKFNRKLCGAILVGTFVSVGATAGFLADVPSYWDAKIWTTWQYNLGGVAGGLLELATIRFKLDKENLHDSTPSLPPVDCSSPEKKLYRQSNGTCNDLSNTTMGSVGTRLGRNVKDIAALARKGSPSDSDIMDPNPLVISRELLARAPDPKDDNAYAKVPFLNMFAAAWIQFNVHDWLDHGDGQNNYALATPFMVSDPQAGPGDLSRMILPRTLKDEQSYQPGYPVYKNTVTPWWDTSQIYGSDPRKASCAANDLGVTLRSCQDGKLRLTADGLLPTDSSGKEVTGFNKNWWVGLSTLHTLFARNHNTIAAELKRANDKWDDEKLFNVSRLVNAAIIAKIHTVEWTPGILPNKTLDTALRANWFGLEKVLKSKQTTEIGAIGAIQNLCNKRSKGSETCAILGGLLGGKVNQHGVPYSITEEFTSVYRLHSLLPEKLEFGSSSGTVKVALADSREEKAHGLWSTYGQGNVMTSFGTQEPGQLIIGNFPRFMRNIEVKVPVLGNILNLDMGAVDIIRDRERGVPRYNEFRRQLNLKPLKTFEDLMPQKAIKKDDKNERFPGLAFEVTEEEAAKNRALTAKLKSIYVDKNGKPDLEKLDLLVGTLTEGYRPRGYGFGETLFQVFILMASRRLQADRFFNESYNAEVYSQRGPELVDEASFRSVLKANFPELRDVKIPQNAFLPWIPKYTDESKHWSDFQAK